jgi:hypothetical protein
MGRATCLRIHTLRLHVTGCKEPMLIGRRSPHRSSECSTQQQKSISFLPMFDPPAEWIQSSIPKHALSPCNTIREDRWQFHDCGCHSAAPPTHIPHLGALTLPPLDAPNGKPHVNASTVANHLGFRTNIDSGWQLQSPLANKRPRAVVYHSYSGPTSLHSSSSWTASLCALGMA